MKKLMLINEKVIHTHAIEIEVSSEDEFDQLLDDLDSESFECKEDVLAVLGEISNIKVISMEDDYSVDVEDIELETKEVD